MKRIFSIAFALVLAVTLSSRLDGQTFGAPEVMRGKIVLGGNADLGFAYDCFYVGVAPQAGLRLTRSLEAGVRLGYDMNYYFGDYYSYDSYFAHYFSGAVYANLELFSGIYVQVEDEEVCGLLSGLDSGMSTLGWCNSVFVGGGYRQYYNVTSFVYYSVMYNLSWDYTYSSFSPYASPLVVRVGFCKGF